MTSSPALLIDLAGIARLADVKRPVASVWRSRFNASSDPFPSVVEVKEGRPLFDAMSVAHWLTRTSHGNNPDVIADAAAASAPAGFDVADPSDVARIDALLTLGALTGRTVGDASPAMIRSLAARMDPDDAFLRTELAAVDPDAATWADLLADAAYSPLEASRLLEKRHAATRAAAGSEGPLDAVGEALLHELVASHTAGRPFALHVDGAVGPTLALDLLARVGDAQGDLIASQIHASRSIQRRAHLSGIALSTLSSPSVNVLTVLRLPSGSASSTSAILRRVDDLALSLRDSDLAVVLAPATALAAPLTAADTLTRADALRSGRVRAIVQLPAGLVVSAPRESVALWVLGRETGDVPVSERFTAIADLTSIDLTPAARTDLASDVRAAMGSAHDVRAHAFRFVRLVRTSSLVASDGDLVAGGAPRVMAGPSPRDIPALLDAARAEITADVPTATTADPALPSLEARTVETLIADGHLRLVRGTRVTSDEFTAAGLVAVGADDLDDHRRIGARRIDPLGFAAKHPSARLTAPGDIVFRTSPTPKAWIDRDGSKIVMHPARVLRIDPADPGGLVPDLIAVDISRAPGGPGSWRRWQLRRVTPPVTAPLRAALVDIAAQRAKLERTIAAIDRYHDLLTAGIVAGVVTLSAPAAPAAPESQ